MLWTKPSPKRHELFGGCRAVVELLDGRNQFWASARTKITGHRENYSTPTQLAGRARLRLETHVVDNYLIAADGAAHLFQQDVDGN